MTFGLSAAIDAAGMYARPGPVSCEAEAAQPSKGLDAVVEEEIPDFPLAGLVPHWASLSPHLQVVRGYSQAEIDSAGAMGQSPSYRVMERS